nr:type II secretion system protein [Moritella sp. Urea-trap-13]
MSKIKIWSKSNTGSKRNSGFTLIELVITIIVLGVLSATAVPRFIDLKDDAKKETVENFHGTLRSTVRLLHMKSQIDNILGDDATIATDYGDYQFSRGYPKTRSEATTPTAYFIETFLELGVPVDVIQNNTTRTATYAEITVYEDNIYSRIGYGTGDLLNDTCYAEYQHTIETQVFSLKTDGC